MSHHYRDGHSFSEGDGLRPRPKIEGYCGRCATAEAWALLRDPPYTVSPAAIVHIEGEEHDGKTACGIDATGDAWWWPL